MQSLRERLVIAASDLVAGDHIQNRRGDAHVNHRSPGDADPWSKVLARVPTGRRQRRVRYRSLARLIQICLPARVRADWGCGVERINRVVFGSDENNIGGCVADSNPMVAAVQTFDVERLGIDEPVGRVDHVSEVGELSRRGKRGFVWVHSVAVVVVVIGRDAGMQGINTEGRGY